MDKSPRRYFYQPEAYVRTQTIRMLVSSLQGGKTDMLTKYALVAIIVLCFTVLGFTLMVGDSLCELSIRERGMEFKAVLAYESKK